MNLNGLKPRGWQGLCSCCTLQARVCVLVPCPCPTLTLRPLSYEDPCDDTGLLWIIWDLLHSRVEESWW